MADRTSARGDDRNAAFPMVPSDASPGMEQGSREGGSDDAPRRRPSDSDKVPQTSLAERVRRDLARKAG